MSKVYRQENSQLSCCSDATSKLAVMRKISFQIIFKSTFPYIYETDLCCLHFSWIQWPARKILHMLCLLLKVSAQFFWATVSFSYALIWIQVFWVWLASVTRDKLSFFLRGKPEVYFQFATKFFGINNPAIFEHQCPKVVGIMALLWQCHSGLQWPISRSNTQGSIQVQIFKKHFFFI